MLKKRNLLFLSLLILSVLLLSSCFLNPTPTEGILKGQVLVPEGTLGKDLTGQALPDATVNIIDLTTGAIIATTTTDVNGYYQVSVPPGGPYILEAVKDGVKLLQVTPQVEIGIEYELGTADCSTTSVALIAQAMLVAEDYPNDLVDINLTDIETDPDFNDVMNPICSTIEAGGDPTASAAIEQTVEDFLYPPAPAPTPTPAPTPATTDLSGLALSGSPANYTFASATYTYNSVTVANDITSITVTPTGAGTITVNGTTVASGVASGAIALTAGVEKTITVIATETGKTAKTYTIKITRNNLAQTTPTFDPEAGAVAFGTTVTITSAGADAIYYTTDGSDPTTSSNNQASTALVINAACTVKALAVKSGSDDSAIGSATYTQAAATAPSNIVLAVGSANPVGGVTNVAIPDAGETDTTGAVTGWVTSTADKIKFTVTDSGAAVSTITIGGEAYTSGDDYIIPSTSDLTIVVTTTETGKSNAVRTFTVTVATTTVINIEAIPGVTAPVTGGTPVTTITATDQYTGIVTWSPDNSTFGGATVYTATITLTAKTGFTLTGVTVNFFTVADATTDTNPADSGVVTAVFPVTAEVAVGNICGGGKVAYILQSGDPGYDANVQHGLIAAADDQSTGIQWYNGSYVITGATDIAIGTGQANTTTIVEKQGAGSYAAQLCHDLTAGGYDDWFLPSKAELDKLYLNKVAIGGFVGDNYWSSSEYDANNAWYQNFFIFSYYDVKNAPLRVRAVRAF